MTEVLILMQLKNLHCISGTAGRVDVVVVCSKLLDEMKKKIKLCLENYWNECMILLFDSPCKIDQVFIY